MRGNPPTKCCFSKSHANLSVSMWRQWSNGHVKARPRQLWFHRSEELRCWGISMKNLESWWKLRGVLFPYNLSLLEDAAPQIQIVLLLSEVFCLFTPRFAVALKISATFLPALLSSPHPCYCKSSLGQVTICRSSLQKKACPVSPFFFCSFFCSRSPLISHVYCLWRKLSTQRALVSLKTPLAFPQTLNSVEVSTSNW